MFPFKREGEDPARMFAGEGDAFRTNRRFHLLAEGQPATRLSTAFDSVTLYGFDPDERPDIYGKIGTSGVSIATLDDMKALFDGFDLCDPTTSVSMTINGPAPTILAMFLNTAIDQRLDRFEAEHGPPADDRRGRRRRRRRCSRTVRGTVQADILKEDQGQNTCIFSTEFSLRVMADMQEWFIEHQVRNFYSVSISGYHIAEAGANPITQLAFTLANGFTYVESYLARGMDIDDFAPNLSFFFSNGMDPEYTVIGRVARRIWAIAMRDRYGANERSQKLKYHVQTSGRSLHAQEMAFNDIRTTLQALCAIYDNANSLHTNAYDEAVTTPTERVGPAGPGHPDDHQPRSGGWPSTRTRSRAASSSRSSPTWSRRRSWPSWTGSASGAACSGPWRPATSGAGSRTSRCSTSTRSTTAACPSSASTPSPHPGRRTGPEHLELARSTEEEKQRQLTRLRDFHGRHALDRPGGPRRPPADRARRRQRLRRADDHGAPRLTGRDHRRPVRGGRGLPAQRLIGHRSIRSSRSVRRSADGDPVGQLGPGRGHGRPVPGEVPARHQGRRDPGEGLGPVLGGERVGLVGQQDQRPDADRVSSASSTLGYRSPAPAGRRVSPRRARMSPLKVGTPTTIHGSRQMGTTTRAAGSSGGRSHSAVAAVSHGGLGRPRARRPAAAQGRRGPGPPTRPP